VADNEEDGKKMPLLDHLVELRSRLLYSAIALFVAFVGCFFVAQEIFDFLAQPLANILLEETGRRFIYTDLAEVFFTQVKVAFFGALVVTFPVFAGQIWAFAAPGLYKHEKSAFLPFLVATPILFLTGAAILYYLLMPVAWQFFLGFQTSGGPDSCRSARVGRRVCHAGVRLIFAFGLPHAARVGIVSSKGLAAKRKYAIVGTFIVAAIITPPDPISQISLALPILVLYEISILLAKLVERNRARRERQQEAAGPGSDIASV
jgi:sec-independent protein translocase protein TatC